MLRALRIISAGMIGAIVFFLAVALFLRQSIASKASGSLDFLAYAAAGWAVLSLPIASVLREGSAFICCVAPLVGRRWRPLQALLEPMGGMVAWFPRGA